MGKYLKNGLERIEGKHGLIGDVRGMGLFLGVELVLDRATLDPATRLAARIIEHMKDRGVLISTDGPFDNVLKIKPPMVFTKENADRLLETLDEVLSGLEGIGDRG